MQLADACRRSKHALSRATFYFPHVYVRSRLTYATSNSDTILRAEEFYPQFGNALSSCVGISLVGRSFLQLARQEFPYFPPVKRNKNARSGAYGISFSIDRGLSLLAGDIAPFSSSPFRHERLGLSMDRTSRFREMNDHEYRLPIIASLDGTRQCALIFTEFSYISFSGHRLVRQRFSNYLRGTNSAGRVVRKNTRQPPSLNVTNPFRSIHHLANA